MPQSISITITNNTLSFEQLLYASIGCLLGIFGFVLVLWGAGILRRRVTNKKVYFGVVLFGIGLSMLVINAPVFATPFTVLATLALAFAAFKTIKQSSEQEQKRRVFEDDKENRSRKEHWLDEVLQWATDIDTATEKELERGYFGLEGKKQQIKFEDDMWRRYESDLITTGDLNRLLRQAIYISTISSGIDKKLKEYYQEAINLLKSRYCLLQKRKEPELLTPDVFLVQQCLAYECITDETKPLNDLNTYWQVEVLMNRNLKSLMVAVDNLIKKASELKVSLLTLHD